MNPKKYLDLSVYPQYNVKISWWFRATFPKKILHKILLDSHATSRPRWTEYISGSKKGAEYS